MPIQIQDQSAEIVADIQNLQNIETDLFNTLETGVTNKTLASGQQTNLINQINKVSMMRESLYKSLDSMQQYYRGTVSSVGNVIGHQLNALQVVEYQLNESKKRLKIIEEEKNNKLRLVEINTYYGEKYADHTGIMKTVVFFCIPIIILAVLANANILPHSIYVFLFIIIVVVAVVVIWGKILQAMSHDNMNYNEYVWGKEPPETPLVDTSINAWVDPWKGQGLTCMAQECCDTNYTYVPSPINKCIANASLPEGVKPYDPKQAQSVYSTPQGANPLDTIGNAASSFTSSASSAASQTTAGVYDYLSKL
jgi:hypothetical protein